MAEYSQRFGKSQDGLLLSAFVPQFELADRKKILKFSTGLFNRAAIDRSSSVISSTIALPD